MSMIGQGRPDASANGDAPTAPPSAPAGPARIVSIDISHLVREALDSDSRD
ncbi:hypothetical protein [Microbacterium sp. Clip185]|uniref:hypothetical protein n=1 Tax=Microbacterium sp. Clip185 TaxID=3025663 RepID=UPI002365B020|nr:hypothetical protein [Microbacterium sp. Clip185]WDG18153.1 hypothetical protein PQV94_00095 [Microbacterium sp. Clip185]